MSEGPINKIKLFAPNDTPGQLTLRLKVHAKVRSSNSDWKQRLLRELTYLMPGITEATFQRDIGKGYHLAIKYGTCGMTPAAWREFTVDSLNAMIAEINPLFVLTVTPKGPNQPLCYLVACRGKVTAGDLALAMTLDEVRHAELSTDLMYKGEAMVVYAPGSSEYDLKLALQAVLKFKPYT